MNYLGGVAAAAILSCTASFAFANDAAPPSTMAGVNAKPMASAELGEVRGANHIIRLVLLRTGKTEMPSQAAADATDRAGSTGGVGNDRPTIVGILNR